MNKGVLAMYKIVTEDYYGFQNIKDEFETEEEAIEQFHKHDLNKSNYFIVNETTKSEINTEY